MNLVHSVEGKNQTTPIVGVWRLWCEHAGQDEQVQGSPLEKITTTNPPHVFEIHPMTKFGNFNLLTSLKPIDGFTYKKAEDAIFRYAGTRCQLIAGNDNTVTIQTAGVGFNYVECVIEVLPGDQVVEDDGRFVFCKILTLDSELVAQKVRIAFVKDSKPEKKVKTLTEGKTMHIIAIPRIDLAVAAF